MSVVMMSETRERFALAILSRVPIESIAELHFFQPIRQGGMESGVAVIAAEMLSPPPDALDAEAAVSRSGSVASPAGAFATGVEIPAPSDVAEPSADTETTTPPTAEAVVEDTVADVTGDEEAGAGAGDEAGAEAGDDAGAGAESDVEAGTVAEGDSGAIEAEDAGEIIAVPAHLVEPPDDERVAEATEALVPSTTGGTRRYTVYTAIYKLALKGMDRGKWETSVVAVADAPLPTIDAVVRGVLRRAGDIEDAERMSGEELRERLGLKA